MNAFQHFIPYGDKIPLDVSSPASTEVQLCHELTMLRHLHGDYGVYGKICTIPWIDQGKMYFLDAYKSNWKSSGLLYYYSFLNLAKAYLVSKRAFSSNFLKSSSIYHGLASEPQQINSIEDFQIDIYPIKSGGKKNIFAIFYEKLLKTKWPFNQKIILELKDILVYCSPISSEIEMILGLEHAVIEIKSILKKNQNYHWCELLIPNSKVNILNTDINSNINSVVDYSIMSEVDKNTWNDAHGVNRTVLNDKSLILINQARYNSTNVETQLQLVIENSKTALKDHILPQPVFDKFTLSTWDYIPKLSLAGTRLIWHPMLSDYLFAFALSTVLRYYPHLFVENSKSSFIAEAWCNQCPIVTLRYFLMEISRKNIRLN